MYLNHAKSKAIPIAILILWISYIVYIFILNSFTLTSISRVTLINNIFLFVCAYFINRRAFTVFTLFIYISCIFHFGQLWIHALSIKLPYLDFNALALFPDNDVIITTVFCLIALNIMVLIGLCLGELKYTKRRETVNLGIKLYKIKKFGYFLFLLTIGPTIYIDYSQIMIASTEGYSAIFFLDVNRFVSLLSSIFPLSVICIMYGNRNTINKVNPLIILIALRSIILLFLVGNRSPVMVQIAIYAYMYFNFTNQNILKNKKLLILTSISLILIISVLPYVALTRGLSNVDLSFKDFLVFYNPVVLLINELGGSIMTPILAVEWVQVNGLSNGLTFGNSLLIFFPFSTSLFSQGQISVSAILNSISPIPALGGSFLAEFYFNFGWYSLFIIVILSYLIIKLSNSLLNLGNTLSPLITCMMLFLLYGLFLYIRGNFYDIAQILNTILYVLLIYYLVTPFLFKNLFSIKVNSRSVRY